ncbi:unnamed protein product, partial [Pylaiella littoralis]
MSDPVGLAQSVLGAFGRAREAVESAQNFPATISDRLKDGESVLEQLQRDPRHVARIGIERELAQLNGLANRIKTLVQDHTSAPEDSCCVRVCKSITRCSRHKELEKQLQEIDGDVARVLQAITAKGITGLPLPPPLPDMAAVPATTLALPRSYVERPSVQEVADGLTNPEQALAPYTVVGMGGGGKTVLASAVVHEQSVRKHFLGGIFWMRVGRGAKHSLLPLLQGLAREMGAAPTDAPHGVPHVLVSLQQVKQHLTAVASTGTSPRLVVLDDVWEREVVDALLSLGLKVLVTTRDRSVVGVPGGRLELGDMTEEEALELLLKTSMTEVQPEDDVRTQMTKVVARCGRLPLVLAIAGSMRVVKGKGLTAGAWEELIKLFENMARMMRARGEQSSSIKLVLETSFDALAEKRQEECLKMAVLAAGAVAPVEMLLNLWEIQDEEGTRDVAEGLVSKCLVQDVGLGGYRVHDLVLEFLKDNIKADAEMVKKATAQQAQYLRRLDVLKSYGDPEHGAGSQGLFLFGALWRSVEELSRDPELEVASYRASLGELESCKRTADAASSYSSVGFLFQIQGKYAEAQRLFERALAINEVALGVDHPSTITSRAWMADLYQKQGLLDKASPLLEEIVSARERVEGHDHPNVASALNNRAGLLESQGKYAEADPLYLRAIEIGEKTLGPDHPDLATRLNNRAGLLKSEGNFLQAEPLFKRTQEIFEKSLGQDHPNVATVLNNRAQLLESQGKYDQADPLFSRAIKIWEVALGPDHPQVATGLNNRAGLLESQGKYAEAEPLYERSQAIRETVLGLDHPDVAQSLNNRAGLLKKQGKYAEAEPLYERSQAIREKVLGLDHPDVAQSLNNRAGLLKAQGKYAEADPLYLRAIEIGEKTLGPDHPDLAIWLNNRAGLLKAQGKYQQAEPLYMSSLAIDEKVYGPDHPEVATDLNNWAQLSRVQGKYAEAEPLYERSQAIREKVLGLDHPDVPSSLNNRAGLLESQEKYREAIPLLERALSIRTKKLGGNHLYTVSTQNSLERVRKKVRAQLDRLVGKP